MTTDFDDTFNSDQGAHGANTSASQAWSDSRSEQFSPERVAATEAKIARIGVLEELATWRAEGNHATGAGRRPTLISDRAILVGLLLLASEHRALWISSLAGVRTIPAFIREA